MSAARICVPVCVGRSDELPGAVARAAPFADVVELRFDCLEAGQLWPALESINELLDSHSIPFIFTLRHAAHGGRMKHDAAERAQFQARLHKLLAARAKAGKSVAEHYVDLEFDEDSAAEAANTFGDLCGVVCSHHDFDGIPDDLGELYGRMAATGAGVVKIAVTANDATDCLAVFRLLERARRDGRAAVVLAMGEAGILTRILGPSRGTALTYGALDDTQRTAPGQISAEELRRLYRVHSITRETLVCGLVGSPVAHSLSPHIHNTAFAARGIDAVYIPLEVSDLRDFVRRMVATRSRELDWNLRGLSITAPHKSAIIEHLDWTEPKAREIGAVNTLVIVGGELRGYNTDAAASLAPLRGELDLSAARVAVIGAGGAARALLWELRETGARTTLFARDAARAANTARQFDAAPAPLEGARFDGFDLVVNATPLGTRGRMEGETPAAAHQLRGARFAYDLVYNPRETRFLREARAAGCRPLGGLPMLLAQAAAQFKLWTTQDAPLDVMREAAERKIKEVRG
ncbi:MAG TPA: shikimate dehydrogenase [Pyrinomonadaceae bacterium]